MQEQKCLLCSGPASVEARGPLERSFSVDCPVCKKYSYSNLVSENPDLSEENKHRLQAVIRERHIKGFPPDFMVVSKVHAPNAITLGELLSQYPETSSEMINRAMLNLSRLTKHPCDLVSLQLSDYAVLFGRNLDDMVRMAKFLEYQGYIDKG